MLHVARPPGLHSGGNSAPVFDGGEIVADEPRICVQLRANVGAHSSIIHLSSIVKEQLIINSPGSFFCCLSQFTLPFSITLCVGAPPNHHWVLCRCRCQRGH